MGVHLIGEGIVEKEGVGFFYPRMYFQAIDNRKRQFPKLCLGELSLFVAYFFSDFCFIHV